MRPSEMDQLIEQHIAAETAGDTAASVVMYTDDIEHDLVGFPTGPVHGKAAAQEFYEHLTKNVLTEVMEPIHTYHGEDFCVVEHRATVTVTGEFLGVPGNGRRVTFRMLHVWEFKEGHISRENIWLDGADIVAQLTAPDVMATLA